MKESLKGHLALIVANIIFGVSLPFSKILMNSDLNVYTLMTLRMFGAALLFWCASLFVVHEKISGKEIVLLAGASILGVIVNQGFYLEGLSHTSPAQCSLLQTLTPIYTLLLATIYLHEPLTARKALGVAVAMLGAVFLILSEQFQEIKTTSTSFYGSIMIMLSGISYAFYLTLFMKLIQKFSPIHIMKWMFLFASIFSIPFIWNKIDINALKSLSISTGLMVFYIVVFGTFISYLLVIIAQKRIRPTLVSMYIYVQPIVATIVAYYFALGVFGWNKVISALLIFAGVYIVTRSKKSAGYLMK